MNSNKHKEIVKKDFCETKIPSHQESFVLSCPGPGLHWQYLARMNFS